MYRDQQVTSAQQVHQVIRENQVKKVIWDLVDQLGQMAYRDPLDQQVGITSVLVISNDDTLSNLISHR